MPEVFSQQWISGDGSQAPPRVAFYRSSTWGGAHTPETTYPNLAICEAVELDLGAGPAGQNVLQSSDPVVASWVEKDIGDLTTPNGTTGWWNAHAGCIQAYIKFDAAVFADHIFSPILSVLGRTDNQSLYVALNRTSAGNFNIALVGQGYDGTLEYWDTGDIATPSINSGTHSGWYTIRLRWQCGTVDGNYADVLPDGLVTVDLGPYGGTLTRILNETGLDLYINDGRQNNQADGASSTFVGPSIADWARGVALGFNGLMPTTLWRVFDEISPSELDEESGQSSTIWRLDVGGAGSGTGTGTEGGGDDDGSEPDGVADEEGEVFLASLITKPFTPTSILNRYQATSALLVAKAADNVEVAISVIPDFKSSVDPTTTDLTPTGSESHVIRPLDELSVSDLTLVQFKFADTATPQGRWNLERFEVRHVRNEKGT